MVPSDENHSIRVFLVDDDPETLEMYALGLGYEGFTVRTTSSSISVVDLLASDPPDCIVADIRMPRLSGLELCRTLVADPRFTGIPRVALTGSGYQHDIQLALAAGFDRVLVKPILPDELAREIVAAVVCRHRNTAPQDGDRARARSTHPRRRAEH